MYMNFGKFRFDKKKLFRYNVIKISEILRILRNLELY